MSDEKALETKLRPIVREIKDLISAGQWNIRIPENKAKWDEMVSLAVELHKLVKPKHHRYMIENRGYHPDDPEFYNHIHPIEDLLKYIENPHANDDPEDSTMGDKFQFKVYSRRWGHEDIYEFIRNEKGWIISFKSSGQADKSGKPWLFEFLDHDSINYPEELPGYLEWLWTQAEEEGLSHEQVQEAVQRLADWVSLCERQSPGGIWRGYK